MALPVRFVADRETVQTTTRELSEIGVFVRCVDPPPTGSIVALTLYPPGAQPFEVKGAINESVSKGGDTGFWAHYVNPSAEVAERIGSLLASARIGPATEEPPTAAPVQPNRRVAPRYLDSFAVTLGGSSSGAFRAANVSASGLFILSEEPPPMDTIIHLVIELPDGAPPAEVQAIVVRRVLPGRSKNMAPGAGVQFIGADDEFHRRLESYLKRR
jgi:hypothetical protein